MIGGKVEDIDHFSPGKGPKRYGEIRKAVPGVTERMLTLQLREMEEDGLLSSDGIPWQVPLRVE